jgi:hypothetical protein
MAFNLPPPTSLKYGTVAIIVLHKKGVSCKLFVSHSTRVVCLLTIDGMWRRMILSSSADIIDVWLQFPPYVDSENMDNLMSFRQLKHVFFKWRYNPSLCIQRMHTTFLLFNRKPQRLYKYNDQIESTILVKYRYTYTHR